MKTKDLLRYFFSCGAVIYTAGSAILLVIMSFMEDTGKNGIEPKSFLIFLAFAYFISLANTIFKIESISHPIRRTIHALLYVGSLLAFLLLLSMEFYVAVIISVAFGIIYAIVLVISALLRGKLGRLNVTESRGAKKASNSTPVSKTASKKKESTPKKEEYKNRFS